MTDVEAILDAAVEELHRAFGYFLCAVVRDRGDGQRRGRGGARRARSCGSACSAGASPATHGLIGRCLRTQRPVLVDDVAAEPDYQPRPRRPTCRSELVVPLWVGGRAVGRDQHRGARDRTRSTRTTCGWCETVADQVGAALRVGVALRAARARVPRHRAGARRRARGQGRLHGRRTRARSSSSAEAVGRALGMDDAALRDLRFAAVFHDIGKIAVPEAILHKPGPLDAEERAVMRAPQRSSASRSSRRWSSSPACGCWCATSTSAGTARGYPDGLAGDGHPARLADHPRLRRAPRDDQRPPVPPGAGRDDAARGAAPQRRHAVRSARGRDRCSRTWTNRRGG